MKYEALQDLTDEAFRRLTGAKRKTFSRMTDILREADATKKKRGGRKNKLAIEDILLMTLEYPREYRTFFHIASDFGVSESTAWKNITWVKNILVGHPDFALVEKKIMLGGAVPVKTMIDATETPIKRPKKTVRVLLG